jgi:cytochrome oxidase Cu insertion factor (SCO1/SenC/PrrC family)
LSREERAAAFAGTAPKVPRKAVISIVSACLVLGFGGIVVDHFFSGASKAGLTPTPKVGNPPPLPSAAHPAIANISASVGSMMALQTVKPTPAPAFSLTSASGTHVSLATFSDKIVVLSFFDGACDDICPIVESEIRQADRVLAAKGDASKVEFLTVNTDPLRTSISTMSVAEKGLAGLSNAVLLTGSLKDLNPVWSAYGVTIEAQPASGVVSHSELMDFIRPGGTIADRATPFANEVGRSWALPSADQARFGSGIAQVVESLLHAGVKS